MQTIKQLTTSVAKFFAAFEKATQDASVNQRKAGAVLASVHANMEVHFRAADDSALTKGAQGTAFKDWYSKLGMSAQFVSVARSRAEIARLVPELEVTLNTDHVKRLAPVLRSEKGQPNLTDTQKRKAMETTMKRAKKLATKAGREKVTGGDIQAARPKSNRQTPEVSVADVATLTTNAVLIGTDTADDIATIASWLEAVTVQLGNREETTEESEAAVAA
jgi:hypothetical protein